MYVQSRALLSWEVSPMGALLGTVPRRWLSVTCHLHPAASRWGVNRFTLGGGPGCSDPTSPADLSAVQGSCARRCGRRRGGWAGHPDP